jgi:hypothetical protein
MWTPLFSFRSVFILTLVIWSFDIFSRMVKLDEPLVWLELLYG